MRNLIKTLQQQNVPPIPSVPPSPHPPHYYHPAANAMMQQQQTNPAYQYPVYPPPMPMWQQPFQSITDTPQQHQGGNHCRRGGGQKHTH
eukprot:12975632-Ditylum_brightwellii.AAC.1